MVVTRLIRTGWHRIDCEKSFLEQFNPTPREIWEELVPGRAAVLRLRGRLGSLDIFVLFFPAENHSELEVGLAKAMLPASDVLAVIMVDFNYVTARQDQNTKPSAQ